MSEYLSEMEPDRPPNNQDIHTIRKYKHQRPDEVPRCCQLYTRSTPAWVDDLLRQEAAYEASSDKYRRYLYADRPLV